MGVEADVIAGCFAAGAVEGEAIAQGDMLGGKRWQGQRDSGCNRDEFACEDHEFKSTSIGLPDREMGMQL